MEPRDRALAEAEAELRRRGEAAAQLQAHLDGWQARLTARAAAWEADRRGPAGRGEGARRGGPEPGGVLADLRRRWVQRRKKEVAATAGRVAALSAARRQYAASWEDCLNHGEALERQQRALAEQALALEQYRLEVIGRAPDSAAAEKRLERCAAVALPRPSPHAATSTANGRRSTPSGSACKSRRSRSTSRPRRWPIARPT